MIAYIPLEDNPQVGELVTLQLKRGNDLLSIIQVTQIKSVKPSPHHVESQNMVEVEF